MGRKLDADALAEMTEGKPSLEEFEKFMRGEIAKDALTSDDAKAEGEQARLEQRSEERKRLEEELMERMAEANRSARTRRHT